MYLFHSFTSGIFLIPDFSLILPAKPEIKQFLQIYVLYQFTSDKIGTISWNINVS